FRMVLGTYPDLKLVIVGKKGWLYEKIYDSARHKDLKKHVIFTGYLPDSHVATLYKNAYMFVLPSFYEGFGIPILEAMSHSCPVIASKVSSLPEIGGDACLYFDPHDAIQLKQTIIKLLDDESLRRDLVKKGKKRIKQFSWEKCGRSTLKILEEVASQTN
ncbi:MAG: glycosyltransferase family 4 protein, partial [Candidatus Paceibacterota bacterium]